MVDINSALSELKLRGQSFVQAYNQLLSDQAAAKQNPSLYAEWQGIKTKADMVANTIAWINKQVDAGINWLQGIARDVAQGIDYLGQTSYSDTINQPLMGFPEIERRTGLHGLGIIPIVLTVAYVTAAIAALLYVINLIYQFHQKLLLVNQGKLSATSLSSPGILSTLSTSAKWIIFGVAAIMILPAVMRSRKNNA